MSSNENIRPQPSGFLETLTDEQRTAALAHTGGDTHPQPSGEQDDDKLRRAVEALERAEAEFEAIRLVLINHLNEPERAAFWKAVYGRGSAQDALAALKTQEGGES